MGWGSQESHTDYVVIKWKPGGRQSQVSACCVRWWGRRGGRGARGTCCSMQVAGGSKGWMHVHAGASVAEGLKGGGNVLSPAQARPAQGELELGPISRHLTLGPAGPVHLEPLRGGLTQGQSLLVLNRPEARLPRGNRPMRLPGQPSRVASGPERTPGAPRHDSTFPTRAAAPQEGGTELQSGTERLGRTNDTRRWLPGVLERARVRGPERR